MFGGLERARGIGWWDHDHMRSVTIARAGSKHPAIRSRLLVDLPTKVALVGPDHHRRSMKHTAHPTTPDVNCSYVEVHSMDVGVRYTSTRKGRLQTLRAISQRHMVCTWRSPSQRERHPWDTRTARTRNHGSCPPSPFPACPCPWLSSERSPSLSGCEPVVGAHVVGAHVLAHI